MWTRFKAALFGRTVTQERQSDDVDALVAGYQSSETTKLLVSFREKLLKANDDRVSAIESKATALVGYSTATLAFLVTRDGPGVAWQRALLLTLIGLFSAVACLSAGLALRAARNWRNMGEATWFPEDPSIVNDPDILARWYLRAMHQSFQDNHRIANKKAGEMICAQLCVAAAGLCLGALLIGGQGRLFALLNDVQGIAWVVVRALSSP